MLTGGRAFRSVVRVGKCVDDIFCIELVKYAPFIYFQTKDLATKNTSW